MSDITQTEVRGHVADGFEAVAEAFEENFRAHGEVGAGVAVVVDGECVVDLTGGVADPATDAPYTDDTLQLIFSSTKGAAAICGHLLAQRGELDFDAPVTDVWPEFGVAGKADATIGMLFSHRVGLPVVDAELTRAEVLAVTPIVEALAAQQPLWEPGSAHGYHALTYGWLVGEIVRRVSGRTIGEFFADEVAGPLGLEFWIGLPDEHQDRVSPLIASRPDAAAFDPSKMDPAIADLLVDLAAAYLDPQSITNRALSLNGIFGSGGGGGPRGLAWNLPEVRASQIPAANGVTNARSLATMYAACVSEVGGVRLLSDETLDRATTEQGSGRDRCLVIPTRFGLGFFLPSSFSPLMGPRSFGHAGAGGSLGLADRDRGVGFGYVMNAMSTSLSTDPRTTGLVAALQSSLAEA